MTFQQKYQNILNIVQKEIEQVTACLTDGIELQEPLKTKVLQVLNAPSKHIRPLVTFLYLKANGLDIDENQILYQSAVELVHNASLIHDDVIDESLTRRSVSTINNDFGNKLAVIAGDYLLSVALDRVLKTGSRELIKMFSDTLAIMSQGEVKQQFSKFKIPTIDEYLEKSEQKTAKLFETSLCGSLMIAKINEITTSNAMHSPRNDRLSDVIASEAPQSHNSISDEGLNFATNFGLAFQIRDDLINCKTSKTDIQDGIYTAPVIFSNGIENLEIGLEKTQILLNNTIENALDEIKHFDESKYKTALKELLELLKYE